MPLKVAWSFRDYFKRCETDRCDQHDFVDWWLYWCERKSRTKRGWKTCSNVHPLSLQKTNYIRFLMYWSFEFILSLYWWPLSSYQRCNRIFFFYSRETEKCRSFVFVYDLARVQTNNLEPIRRCRNFNFVLLHERKAKRWVGLHWLDNHLVLTNIIRT